MRFPRMEVSPLRRTWAVARRLRRERGQVLWTAALLLPVMLGMAGIAADVGAYAAERRSLQNAADSIALAAGQGLPDEAEVHAIADEWAAKNNVDPAQMTVTVSGGTSSPAVTVAITEEHQFAFMRVIGIEEKDVGARAVAGKFSAGSGSGVVPWSISEQTLAQTNTGESVPIKYDSSAGPIAPGNFGVIRIDGNGSSTYEESAKFGAETVICAQGTALCTVADCTSGSYPATCAESAPGCTGDECAPENGNMKGATRDAVDFRIDNTSSDCDTFDEVFSPITASADASGDVLVSAAGFGPRHHGGGGHPTYTPTPSPTPGGATATPTPGSVTHEEYALNPACNPWGAGACPPAPSSAPCSRRVILIPIIDEFSGGQNPVVIKGFALMFLEGHNGCQSGNDCEVQARFVKAELTTGALAGEYDEDALVQFVKLIE
ncbi:MAG TPA: TadE/TadG family type IV pilus assembly protein [Dehalococcoidia bacterium]|nr:TadE/TadG family type IV pilus assembly protein [Dehalococcoidia bacterium]